MQEIKAFYNIEQKLPHPRMVGQGEKGPVERWEDLRGANESDRL